MRERMEMSSYVNHPRRPKPVHDSPPKVIERKWCQILILCFGLLCLIQATLSITLRLTAKSECSTTAQENQTSPPFEQENQTSPPFEQETQQERIKALEAERNRLENKNRELRDQIKELNDQISVVTVPQECVTVRPVCPDGWREMKSRCYFLSSESRSWDDSRRHCLSLGADLVVISNEQEQRDLYRMNGDIYLLSWIGLHDVTNSGTFKWVDNTPLTTTFWKVGQPGDGGPNNPENCVEMYHEDEVLGCWNDAPCAKSRRWVCEKEAQK